MLKKFFRRKGKGKSGPGKKRHFFLGGVLITIVAVYLQIPTDNYLHQMVKRFDFLLYDIRFNLLLPYKPVPERPHNIVIIDLDERSLQEEGRWPWSRKKVKELIDSLVDQGAIAVTFDVVFSEPERNIAEEMLANNPSLVSSEEERQQLLHDYDYDRLMAETMMDKDVILGFFFHLDDINFGALPPHLESVSREQTSGLYIHNLPGYTANISVLQEAARGIGYVTIVPDIDGVIRRAQLVLKHEGNLYPSLALQTAMVYGLYDDAELATIQEGENEVVTGLNLIPMFGDKVHIPTDPQAQILIPYRGKRGAFPYLPATDVMNYRLPPEQLENSIAVIGTSAAGLLDLRTTPLETGYPGVEAQVTIIDALLLGDSPQTPDWAIGANVLGILILGTLLSFIMPKLGPQKMIMLAFAMTVFVIANNYYLWFYQNLNLDLAIPLVLVFTLCSANLCFGFFTEAAQRNAIKSAFNQYVAPAHIDKLLNQGDDLSFDGETKEMTVLFCDIRGFTSISEKLTANELKNMLNEFFTPMTEIIFEQMGTIDKYVGDMIMAFWGAPLDDPDQKLHSVSAALLMQEKVEDLKNEFREKGYPEVNIGIGLNTGQMNVGDMGSVYRRAYTVLGDAVNLGSRLESITKFYGAKILVSESTMSEVDEIIFREVDYIQVKGKNEPIKVYEPVTFRKKADKNLLDAVERYHQARQHFLNRNWDFARSILIKLAEDDPSMEKLCSVYLERIRIFKEEPPEEGWEGVWRHDSK